MSELVNTYLGLKNKSELGKQSELSANYDPDRLYAIIRNAKRQEIGIDPNNLPFSGFDAWTHFEVSWLNEKGKPMVAIAEIVYPCDSPKIIESKSLKLYFNSFNNTQISSITSLESIIKKDLEQHIGARVLIKLHTLQQYSRLPINGSFTGESIDHLDVECSVYSVEPAFLSVHDYIIEETLYSDLLKSNCLVTNQPDWGSVQIAYKGQAIDRKGLLKYLVSYRNHNEFHEQCIERIFVDITTHCQPEKLSVYGRYTRRGGLDINPYRTSEKIVSLSIEPSNRLIRQ